MVNLGAAVVSLVTCYSRSIIRSDPPTISLEPTHVQTLAGMEEHGKKATGEEEFGSGKIFCASGIHLGVHFLRSPSEPQQHTILLAQLAYNYAGKYM
jgi:hypothetical protein